MKNSNSPIWNYIASGAKYVLKKEILKEEGLLHPETFKVQEGVKMNLVVSMASVIEGSLRDFLVNEIHYLINEKERIENIHPEKNKVEGRVFQEESIEELQIKLGDINNSIKRIISIYNKSFDKEKNSNYKEIFSEIATELDKEEWENLKGHFKKITGVRLKSVLEIENEELFNDIQMIFAFRNFIVHSNFIKIKFGKAMNTKQNDFPFEKRSSKLIQYINFRGLDINRENHPFFVESLFTDKLVIHFDKCLDLFLENKYFEKSFRTLETKNFIWR